MSEFMASFGPNKKHMFSLDWSKLGLDTIPFTRRNKNKNNWKMSEQTDIIPWFITQAVLPHFTCVPWQRFDKYRMILLVKLESLTEVLRFFWRQNNDKLQPSWFHICPDSASNLMPNNATMKPPALCYKAHRLADTALLRLYRYAMDTDDTPSLGWYNSTKKTQPY